MIRHALRGFARLRAVGLVAAVVLIAPGVAVRADDDKIDIKGSDSMVILNQELAAAFANAEPDTALRVSGGGSNRGVAALFRGDVDIAACSRQLLPEEIASFRTRFDREPLILPVALDGLGVYVHNTNPVTRLTLQQVRAIFTGEITNWQDVGGPDRPINVISRDEYSGTYESFKNRVLGDGNFTRAAKFVSTTSTLISMVSRYRWAIGYGGIAYSSGARVVRLAEDDDDLGTLPTVESVSSNRYPLSRMLHYVVDPEKLTPELETYVRWVLGPEGREQIATVGYYPLSDRDTELALGQLGDSR